MSNNRLAVLEAALNQAEAACIAAEQHREACERELCAACAAMAQHQIDLIPVAVPEEEAVPAPCGGKVGSDGD